MSDIVVTVPKQRWAQWIEEGDLPGEEWSGLTSHFFVPHLPRDVADGDLLFVVAHGKLRGYAPILAVEDRCGLNYFRSCLLRNGDAVAVTIPQTIRGFQGWRYRWWDRDTEVPFPDWMTP